MLSEAADVSITRLDRTFLDAIRVIVNDVSINVINIV